MASLAVYSTSCAEKGLLDHCSTHSLLHSLTALLTHCLSLYNVSILANCMIALPIIGGYSRLFPGHTAKKSKLATLDWNVMQ